MDSNHNKTDLLERIFQKLFTAAEIAKYSPQEREQYEESLKYYRDLKNVVDILLLMKVRKKGKLKNALKLPEK